MPGKYVENLSGDAKYLSYKPNALPNVPFLKLDDEAVELLVKATSAISALDIKASMIPNRDLFVAMYVRKEALISSQIEGTQCTLDDVLDVNNDSLDVADVVNYISALNFAIERNKELPLCNRLLRETHSVLLQGVRGDDKTPGEFRKTQNWIGFGGNIKNATYIPPNVDDMEECMDALEEFINSENVSFTLIKTALIHYQFETIHPFLDGNGRIGRLLIILYLMQEGLLHSPVLYPSWYLKLNRVEYYDRMMEVRKTGDYLQWVKFFLRAMLASAEDASDTIDALCELHNATLALFEDFSPRTRNGLADFLAYLEKNPIIDTVRASNDMGISYNTVAKYIDIFLEKSLLEKTSKVGKTVVYSYAPYLSILRKDA
ncbi:MAG: Fic family protein [Oscillospiraceae bacterium]|nr:Fic family protein [Candidatus Limimonas coprohippi]